MTAEPRRRIWPIVVMLVFLPMFYLLSLGPLNWLAIRGYLPIPLLVVLDPIYRPATWFLTWAAESSELAGAIIQWYLDLFN